MRGEEKNNFRLTTAIKPFYILPNARYIEDIFKPVREATNKIRETNRHLFDVAEVIKTQFENVDFTSTYTYNLKRLFLFLDGFSKNNIVVDSFLLNYIEEKYFSYQEFIHEMEEAEDIENFVKEELRSVSKDIESDEVLEKIADIDDNHRYLVREIQKTISLNQHIAATLLCLTLLESFIQKILKYTNLDLKKEAEDLSLSKKMNDQRKLICVLGNKYKYNPSYDNYPVEKVENLVPLILLGEGLSYLENASIMQSRNNLIHFNKKIKYGNLNCFTVMQLLQIVKITSSTDVLINLINTDLN